MCTELRDGEKVIRVHGPTVECGGLLLALARHVTTRRPEKLPCLYLDGGDVVHFAAELAASRLVANCSV